MKKVFYLIAVAGLVATSCSKTDKNIEPEHEEPTYSFSIGAEKESDEEGAPETRLELIDGAHHWSVGDKVGMFIYSGNIERVANLPMTGQHTEPTRSTSFVGEMTQSQISQFFTTGRYRYTTYYPYNANAVLWTDWRLQVDMATEMSIRKNQFPSAYAFMYAHQEDAPPITWLDGNGEQQYNTRIPFNYTHAYSYLRLKIDDASLMNGSVSKIEITSTTDQVAGNYEVEFSNSISVVSRRYPRTRTITIAGNMGRNDYLYIPMFAKTYAGGTLTFRFTYTNGVTTDKLIPVDITLEQGKIHGINFKLPYVVDFGYGVLPTHQWPLYQQTGSYTFTYMSDTFGGNGGYQLYGDRVGFDSGIDILTTPAFDLRGKTTLPVQVKARIRTYAVDPNFGGNYFNVFAINQAQYDTYSERGSRVYIPTAAEQEVVSPSFNLSTTNTRVGIYYNAQKSMMVGRETIYLRGTLSLYKLEVCPI